MLGDILILGTMIVVSYYLATFVSSQLYKRGF